MKRACIAIVDASRARLYTYDEENEPTSQLREIRDLVNPGRRLRASEMFSETRPSLGHPGRPGLSREPGSTRDDHRDDHIDMMDMKFAKEIVAEIDRILKAGHYGHLIVVASPRMLGELRKANGVLKRNNLVVDEIPRDLAKLTSSQLHDHLASMELLPPRARLSLAR